MKFNYTFKKLMVKFCLNLLLLNFFASSAAFCVQFKDPLLEKYIGTENSEGEISKLIKKYNGKLDEPKAHLEELWSILSDILKYRKDDFLGAAMKEITLTKMQAAMEAIPPRPIRFYIPSFPVKSPNTEEKVISREPDLAEEIAMARLGAVIKAMNQIYPTEIDIISDGRIFAGSWWCNDEVVNTYRDKLIDINHRVNGNDSHINILDISSFFEGKSEIEARELILNGISPITQKQYAPADSEIKESIKKDPTRLALYNAFKAFFKNDQRPSNLFELPEKLTMKQARTGVRPKIVIKRWGAPKGDPQALTCKQRKAIIKERVYEMIRRNDALNTFLAERLDKNTIRLSIRPQDPQKPEKMGINLLEDDPSEMITPTPWHCTIVIMPDHSYRAMTRAEAEKIADLVMEDGLPHFVFNEQKAIEPLGPFLSRH